MLALLVDQEGIEPTARRKIEIEAADPEEALVTFLQEILYLYEVGRFLPATIDVTSAGASGVCCRLTGEPFDPRRHQPRADIKAVTYHNLEIVESVGPKGAARFETVIIFDI